LFWQLLMKACFCSINSPVTTGEGALAYIHKQRSKPPQIELWDNISIRESMEFLSTSRMSSHSCSNVKPSYWRLSGHDSEHQRNLQPRQTLTFAIIQVKKITFSMFSRMQILLSTQLYLILVSAVSLSVDIIARFVSLSSVIVWSLEYFH